LTDDELAGKACITRPRRLASELTDEFLGGETAELGPRLQHRGERRLVSPPGAQDGHRRRRARELN